MHHRSIANAAALSDADLLGRVTLLAGGERESTVELVGHLAELDARKLHLREGYGSLFSYCTDALRLAEHAAYNRIEAARLSRRFPAVLDLLADGSLNLSTVRLLAPHLRPGNFDAVVARAQGRSKREVEALVAGLAPRPDAPATVRKLPTPAAVVAADAAPAAAQAPAESENDAYAPAVASESHRRPPALVARAATPRAVVAALAPERYRVQFTIGAATHEKLRRVQDLLRREIPDGDPGEIFDRALTLLLEDVARRKLAAVRRPRRGMRSRPGSRDLPANVKRTVWRRDAGQCAFVAPNGRRCTERAFLEFHHCEPYAIGGEPTVENISLRCRPHNVYEAELVFGPGTGARDSVRDGLAPGRDVGATQTGDAMEAEVRPEVRQPPRGGPREAPLNASRREPSRGKIERPDRDRSGRARPLGRASGRAPAPGQRARASVLSWAIVEDHVSRLA